MTEKKKIEELDEKDFQHDANLNPDDFETEGNNGYADNKKEKDTDKLKSEEDHKEN